jgi:hypothetical protein
VIFEASFTTAAAGTGNPDPLLGVLRQSAQSIAERETSAKIVGRIRNGCTFGDQQPHRPRCGALSNASRA